MRPLRILQVLRSPVGGLFRHVADLAHGLNERGHQVGIVADSSTGGARAEATLGELARELALGVVRLPMSRLPSPGDVSALLAIGRHAASVNADVVHGHGSKGGLYARAPYLISGARLRAYTPHGGSLHYTAGAAARVFGGAEKLLERTTDLFLFESQFAAERYSTHITPTRKLTRVVHNGVHDAEFAAVPPDVNAADILFIGELRLAKGIDTLVDALPLAAASLGRPLSLNLVGEGPDEAALRKLVQQRGLEQRITFAGAIPARDAFALGRILAVPSRNESLPYIVLEAAAAGIALVATNVGGIPEIFGADAPALIPPDDPAALASAICARMQDSVEARQLGQRLRERVRQHFSVAAMVDGVLDAYRAGLAGKAG